jgi:hypothetical protein
MCLPQNEHRKRRKWEVGGVEWLKMKMKRINELKPKCDEIILNGIMNE